MHLSKNSRYVLQKAQFLPPFDFLKGIEKNLSVKIPKDDPTKPALRVNIPEDRPRSKSIGSNPQTPPIKSTFQETLLQTTENDIQFSKFSVDDILSENNLNPNKQPEGVRLSNQDAETTGHIQQSDYDNDLQTVLNGSTNSEGLGDTDIPREQKRQNLSPQQDIDPKNLYIIIDVPGKREENRLRVADIIKEKSSDLLNDKNYSFMRGLGQTLERKSKSVPRFSTVKRTSPKHLRSNFEVHEFDDESTYVFHLKLDKKDGGILCVPERDVTTRRGEDKMEKMEGPITVGSGHPLRKQVTIVEERPEAIRYDGKSTKLCKGDDLKRKSGSEDISLEASAAGLNRTEEPGRKRGKAFNLFVEDDFRTIRNGMKTYPFKMPSKQTMKKRDGEGSHDDPSAEKDIVTTTDWWKKDPRDDPRIHYETDIAKMKEDVISTSQEKGERIDRGHNEPPPMAPPPPPPMQHPQEPPQQKSKPNEPTSPYFNISDVISENPDYTIMNRNLSDKMYDTKEHFYNRPETKPRPPIDEENGPKYFNIEEVIPEDKRHSLRRITERKKRHRKLKQPNKHKRLSSHAEVKRSVTKEKNDFHTTANCLSIGCESSVSGFLPFGSAFPPLLCEALKSRFKFRKDLLLTERWNNLDGGLKGKTQKECSLEENAILFPEKQSGDLECDNLFIDREEIVANLIKSSDAQTQSKNGSETTAPAVDPLTLMKKVKEIVQFDLNNAVKIFNDNVGNSDKEVSSVVMVKGEGAWQVDRHELSRHVEMRKNEMKAETAIRSPEGKSVDKTGNKTGDHSQAPLYLPPKTENNEMKLDENRDSVVVFNSKTNEFFIRKEALAKAISERTHDTFGEVLNTLNVLAEENLVQAKSGDSILVYDVETKSWKVDFSILEKRQQQQQIEEELTKRSEAILETFERFEKEQFNNIPKPNSPEKKTFDYEKEEWKAYNSGKKNMSKSKLPFKKSNAEEIRKKNSDLYENLFDGKKKVAANNSEGSDPNSDPSKQSKLCGSKQTDQKGTPAQPSKSDTKVPLGKSKPHKEDDHFWETFLRIQIPPKPSKGPLMEPLRSPTMPKPSIQPKIPHATPSSSPASTVVNVPKLDPEKPVIPPKKIEEPRFRIHLPFIRDRKNEKPKTDVPTKDDKKVDVHKKPNSTNEKMEKKDEPPKVRAPPPPSSTTTKGDPPKGMPSKSSSTINSLGSHSNFDASTSKKSNPDVLPSSSTSKIHDPKVSGGKNDKTASASEHYVSDKIIELTRSKNADHHSKIKANKIETVKLNITSDTRMPSKVTEINLGKKPEEKAKEQTVPSKQASASKAETSTSKVDTSASKLDTSASKVDSRASKMDIRASKMDIRASKVDTRASKVDTSASKVDPRASKLDIRASKLDSRPGKVDIRASKVDTSASKLDTSASKVDSRASKMDIRASKVDTSASKVDTSASKVDTSASKVDTSASKVDTRASKVDTRASKVDTRASKVDTRAGKVEASPSKSKVPVLQHSKSNLLKLNKHLEGFKSTFSEPDFDEKLMKIKPDLESNPNLKKLDNWSKTLVLHDIMKPPENLETWLKDETDKMATLLLKVLQEAGDAKTKKKQTKVKDKHLGKGNERKKQKNSSDNYFFRVQTMNLAVGNDKKLKSENAKMANKAEPMKDVSIKPGKLASSSASLNTAKVPSMPSADGDGNSDYNKAKRSQSTFGTSTDSLMYKDLTNQVRFPLDITDDVPGPEILKKIANAWRVVPILGSQLTVFSLYRLFQLVNLGGSFMGNKKSPTTRSQAFNKLFSKYGPVVNVQGPLSGNVIFLYKPEHLHAVFDQDAPLRSVFDSFEQSRKDVEERFSPTVISTDWNKPEWNELRRGTNDPLTKGWEMYFGSTKMAADSLVYVIRRNRNAQDLVSEDFMHEIKRWSLEGMCQILFEKSFGYLEGRVNSDSWILEPEKLYMAMDEATTYLNKCERGFQSWRLFTTPSLAGLTDSYRSISSVILKQLNQAEINLKGKNDILRNGSFMANMDLTFIESMLLNDGLTPDELICNLADTMVIGTSMMNSTLGFLLYNLAQNVHAQKKLFTELKEILPSKSSQLDYYKLNSLKYLQACLKESLRLHPPIPIFYRLLQNDILVGNYIIPKGSYVVMDCGLSNMKEQNFEDSRKFVPERWLDEEKLAYASLPIAPFPFCHGPRGELMKRVVEMQLTAGIAKIIRNFTVEYHYEDIQGTDTFISYPDKPLKLNFVERQC